MLVVLWLTSTLKVWLDLGANSPFHHYSESRRQRRRVKRVATLRPENTSKFRGKKYKYFQRTLGLDDPGEEEG